HRSGGQDHGFQARRPELRKARAARQGQRGKGKASPRHKPPDRPGGPANRDGEAEQVSKEGHVGDARPEPRGEGERGGPQKVRVTLYPLPGVEDWPEPRRPVFRVPKGDEGVVGEPAHRPGVNEATYERERTADPPPSQALPLRPHQRSADEARPDEQGNAFGDGPCECVDELFEHPRLPETLTRVRRAVQCDKSNPVISVAAITERLAQPTEHPLPASCTSYKQIRAAIFCGPASNVNLTFILHLRFVKLVHDDRLIISTPVSIVRQPVLYVNNDIFVNVIGHSVVIRVHFIRKLVDEVHLAGDLVSKEER